MTAREGSYSAVLTPVRPGPDCAYVGAHERPGTYTIEVALGARMATAQGGRVNDGECHVTQTAVDVTLPASAP